MPGRVEYEGIAWNPATASENRIHSDEVARRHGFRGGLVPGVTVYAYGVQPAVRIWGLDWLAGGEASVVLKKPLYDGESFRVETVPDSTGFGYRVVGPDDRVCAEGRAAAAGQSPPPVRRGDAPGPAREDRPEATRAVLEDLRAKGLGSLRVDWDGRGEQGRYRLDPDDMPDLVRDDRDGFANPSFSLGLANWVLSSNVRLGPWIHVESRVCHHAAIPLGAGTWTEARITDLFERRGHEFVDLDVAVFDQGDRPLLSAFHRAIYRLREPG